METIQLFFTPPETLFQQLSLGCADSFDNQCLICQEGWIKNIQFQICQPNCGDNIIQGEEECDDGNQIARNGCFECVFSCTEFRKTCQFGVCQECESGFIINLIHTCDPLCGDDIVIPYSAEQYECQNCRFHQGANCRTSYYSKCLECNLGFYNQEYSCYPYCVVKIILKQYEDCDDGNEQPFDGCYECKYQCIQGCNICDHGLYILKCDDGYKFANNSCISICGDQIINKEEDCEDVNQVEFDGCYNCKLSCPKNCKECYKGICQVQFQKYLFFKNYTKIFHNNTCLGCDNQYQLSNSNECKQNIQCGNGLLQESEDCDDGNDFAIDGCKKCRIDPNWVCDILTTNSPSQCIFLSQYDTEQIIYKHLIQVNRQKYIPNNYFLKPSFFNQKTQIRKCGITIYKQSRMLDYMPILESMFWKFKFINYLNFENLNQSEGLQQN
ncbi:unnamed protein product [Paramecium octaurelia]|uniref:Chitin-binding type-2 domain-containing protein n=1 Tax=Paramecium octaurelia TaxID=43137 RepID=A0A8S1WGG3_PAROT|nr:unnamed protein product [Paramecium octaurelia]